MRKDLQDQLYTKYPEIFAQHKLPMSKTCMCWGIECGDGWSKIIDKLCSNIMLYCKKARCKPPQFTQVKEKFGTLRVYSTYCEEIIEELIDLTELRSSKTCETCGDYGKLYDNGWLVVRCKPHYDEWLKQTGRSK